MTTRIDLPGGAWADIKAPDELTEKDRRSIRKAGVPLVEVRAQLRAAGLQKPEAAMTDDERERAWAITMGSDAVSDQSATFVIVYTTAWSYNLPVNIDTVLDLPAPVFDALVAATMPQGDGTPPNITVDGAADPTSPTVPSTV